MAVISAATNQVVRTLTVGNRPFGVAFTPPALGSFTRAALQVTHESHGKGDVALSAGFSVLVDDIEIKPVIQPVTLENGDYIAVIAPGSSVKGTTPSGDAQYTFQGQIDGADVRIVITSAGDQTWSLEASGHGVDVQGIHGRVTVTVLIGSYHTTTQVRVRVNPQR